MNKNYFLNFIRQEDFENHVRNTIREYQKNFKSINLKDLNKNKIDPIKLLFDKKIFHKTYEEIISLEIQRQRDKSNNNSIGYFHQNIFKYIKNCKVPEEGWDIIFDNGYEKYFIELKNKHNTMNSSSSKETFSTMYNSLKNDKNNNSIYALVEVIASNSQNKIWSSKLENKKIENDRIRKISIDKFYEIITKDPLAFQKLCLQLPITIDKILNENRELKLNSHKIFQELKKYDDILILLYKLAFKNYEGFDFDLEINKKILEKED